MLIRPYENQAGYLTTSIDNTMQDLVDFVNSSDFVPDRLVTVSDIKVSEHGQWPLTAQPQWLVTVDGRKYAFINSFIDA